MDNYLAFQNLRTLASELKGIYVGPSQRKRARCAERLSLEMVPHVF